MLRNGTIEAHIEQSVGKALKQFSDHASQPITHQPPPPQDPPSSSGGKLLHCTFYFSRKGRRVSLDAHFGRKVVRCIVITQPIQIVGWVVGGVELILTARELYIRPL